MSEGGSTRSFSQDNFALHAEEIVPDNFEGLTFSTDSMDNFKDATVGTSSGTNSTTSSIASITLPPSLLDGDSNDSRRLSFSVFADDILFQARELASEFQDLEVGSVFVSATLHGSTVSDLTDVVTVRFEKTTVSIYLICVRVCVCVCVCV